VSTVTYKDAMCVYDKAQRPAVDRLNLSVNDKEFLVLVGPSGCGKTTTLRMLAGLEEVSAGTILIDDAEVSTLAPRSRDIAMVFQNYALYPHMSVAQNMGFALKIAKVKKAEIVARVKEAAELLDLGDYLDRKPAQLSGGQRQRVAMGRAIVRKPRVFLMDEPLSNLDAKLRVATRTQIAALQRRLGVTTVYVTHDQVEAMTMGDRVAVMKDGVLQQVDTPRALYNSPANAFVAGFIGSPATNLIAGTIVPGGIKIGSALIPLPPGLADLTAPGSVTAGIRPEAFEFVTEGDGIKAVVGIVEELGAESYVYAELTESVETGIDASHLHGQIIARVDPSRPPRIGEIINLRVRDGAMLLFDSQTGERIRPLGAP
jgi:multiple sugar transport system ATP-binding protein